MLFIDGLAVVGTLSFVRPDYARVPDELEWIARVGTLIQTGGRRYRVRCIVRAASEAGFMRAINLVGGGRDPALFLFVVTA